MERTGGMLTEHLATIYTANQLSLALFALVTTYGAGQFGANYWRGYILVFA